MSDSERFEEQDRDAESGGTADETADLVDDAQVMAVLPDEAGEAGVVAMTAGDVAGMVAGLQAEFAGAAKTGKPAIDAALERLGDLDPTDLAASADVLQDVLKRLESALSSAEEADIADMADTADTGNTGGTADSAAADDDS